MIKTIDVECNAANPNLPLKPMFAFVNSPSSIRVRNVPKRIGDWCIRKVYFTAVYPDSTVKTSECVLTGGVWVGTIEGTNTSGTSTNGYTIFADGTDENGNNITGYVLGKGDIEILEADGTLSPDPARYTVKLLSAEATQPREGDMYPTDDGYVIWQSGQANLLGTPFEQITAYVDSAISSKADLSAIPSNTSQLSNDSGFVTSEEVKPHYKFDTSTGTLKPTEMASYAICLAGQYKANYVAEKYAQIYDYVEFDPVELTPKFTLMGNYLGYFPWKLSKFFDQTYSPELELVWWYGPIYRVLAGRFITMYTGFMWRTKGIGFAIPCDQNGIPDGRLLEITLVEETSPYRIGFNMGTPIHTITGNENWSAILTIDEQENQITCTRSVVQRVRENKQTFPTLDDIPTSTSQLTNDSGFITSADVPTKTSDLTNDSGFITSADIITKRDIMDMRARGVPQNTNAQSWFTIKYETTTENAWYYDEGRWESGNTTRVIAAPATIYTLQKLQDSQWTNIGEFQLDNNAEATVTYDGVTYSITGYVGEIVTSNQLISQIAALEARIAALEGN